MVRRGLAGQGHRVHQVREGRVRLRGHEVRLAASMSSTSAAVWISSTPAPRSSSSFRQPRYVSIGSQNCKQILQAVTHFLR